MYDRYFNPPDGLSSPMIIRKKRTVEKLKQEKKNGMGEGETSQCYNEEWTSIVHQPILAAPSSPRQLRGICPPYQSQGGAVANLARHGGRALTLLVHRMRFFQREDFKETDVCGPSKINGIWTI